MYYLLTFLGHIFAILPDCVLLAICRFIGFLICFYPSGRIRHTRANVARCFPNLSHKEHKKIVFESASRMVEMALFVLASPYLKDDYIRARIKLSAYVAEELNKFQKNPEPYIFCIPHFCMMETVAMFPILHEGKTPPVAVFYRPFDSKGMERWIKQSRERLGINLLSRKDGLMKAINFLKVKGCVAVLFDQEAGFAGVHGLFFDRVCRMSDLPGIFVEKTKARTAIFYAKRTGFWSAEILGEYIDNVESSEDLTVRSNIWLENKLKTDAIARYDWLWMHRRWKCNITADTILQTEARKSILEDFMRAKSLDALPKAYKILITMPREFSSAIAFLPILRAMRKSRSDASYILLCEPAQKDILEKSGLAEKVISMPSLKRGAFARLKFFRSLRYMYAETHIVLDDSFLADLCGLFGGAEHRLAMQTYRKRRFMQWVYRTNLADTATHVSLEFERYMRRFGLKGEVSYEPISIEKNISENESDSDFKVALKFNPESSEVLGVDFWSQMLNKISSSLKNAEFLVYGDKSESKGAYEILRAVDGIRIVDRTGFKSNLELIDSIAACDMAISADSDFSHLANMFGIPLAALYGKANPIRNGLAFDSPKVEILPENSPPQGGLSLLNLNPLEAADAVLGFADSLKTKV